MPRDLFEGQDLGGGRDLFATTETGGGMETSAIPLAFKAALPPDESETKGQAGVIPGSAYLGVPPRIAEPLPKVELFPIGVGDDDDDTPLWENVIDLFSVPTKQDALATIGRSVRPLALLGDVRKGALEMTGSALKGIGGAMKRDALPYDSPVYKAGEAVTDYAKMLDPYMDLADMPSMARVLAHGTGSLGPFLGLGMAGAAASPALAWAYPALAGSFAIRNEQQEEALQYNATPEEATLAGDIGGYVGLSEALLPGAVFGKIAQKAGGQKFIDALAKLPQSVRDGLVKGTVVAGGAALEGLQESFEQLMQNFTARDWVGYDPDREPTEFLKEAFGVGAGSAGIAMSLMQLFTGKRYSPSRQTVDIPQADLGVDADDTFHASSRVLSGLPDPEVRPTTSIKGLRRIMGQQQASEEERRLVDQLLGMPGIATEDGMVDVARLRDALQRQVFPIRPQSGLGWVDYGHGAWQGHPNAMSRNHQRRPLLTTAVPRLRQIEAELRARVDAGEPLTQEEYVALLHEDVTQEKGREPFVESSGDPTLSNVLYRATGTHIRRPMDPTNMAQATNELRSVISNALDPRVTLPSGSLTWRAPFRTFMKSGSGHPPLTTSDYVGHTRYFVDPLEDPSTIYMSEVQSDRKQKELMQLRMLQKDAEEISRLEDIRSSLRANIPDDMLTGDEPHVLWEMHEWDMVEDPITAINAQIKEAEKEARKRGTWEKLQARNFDVAAINSLMREEELNTQRLTEAREQVTAYDELFDIATQERAWPGSTDLQQRVRKMSDEGDMTEDTYHAYTQGLDAFIERLTLDVPQFHHELNRREEAARRLAEDISSAGEQFLLERPAEQDILNYEAQEFVRWAAQQGYSKVRIPTVQTAAVVQNWQTKKGYATQLTPEQVRALVVDERGYNQGDFYGTDPETGRPETSRHQLRATRARRHQRLVKAIEAHFAKRLKMQGKRGTPTPQPTIVQDRHGYEWLEIPITEGTKQDVTFMYGFPGPIPEIIQEATTALAKGTKRLFTKLNLNEPSRADQLNEDMDRYNNGVRIYNTLTQLVKINPHIPGIKKYVEGVRRFWNTKSRWLARADERLKEIMDLSWEQQKSLFRLALATTVESERKGRRLTDEEIIDLGVRSGANPSEETMLVYSAMDADFRAALEELYSVLVAERRRNFAENEAALRTALLELDREFGKLRNKNFFPLSRFGKQYVTVRTMVDTQLDGVQYSAGDVIDFRTFEGVTAKIQQRAFYKKLQEESRRRRIKVSAGEFQEEIRGLLGLPPQAIELFRKNVNLTAEQKTQLADLVTQLSPATSFMRHMIERKATPGFSLDGIRGYADYFQKFSNYIARETHKGELSDSVNEMRESIKEMDRLGKDHTKRDGIVSHLQRHMDYLYDPGNEAASLRAAAFVFYLGAVVKSAYVNLTQPILVTYPYLAARYGKGVEGDVKAVYNLSKSYVDLAGDKVAAVLGRAMGDVTEALVRPELIEPELAEAISRGVQDNFLEESFATEVAGVAEGNLVSRMMPSSGVGRLTRRLGGYSAWLFQQAERLNRRVAFIAGFRLARGKIAQGRRWVDLSQAERELVYEAARDAVESSQYEYARWNRAEFMRGPTKSLIFTFYQYIQNTLFFATKDPGRGRFLLVMLVTAGLMGLPGAEDLMDLLDAVLTKYPGLRKRLGLSDKPMTDLRLEAREILGELTNPDTADLIMHGVSRKYGLGPLHLAQLAGVPVPNVDLSASLSLGRLLPAGPEYLRDLAYGKDGTEALQEMTVNAAGAAFAIPLSILQMLGDNHPDRWKTYERALPTFMKHAVKAYRYWTEGEDYGRTGESVVEFDKHNPVEFAEIIAAGAGFPPERLSREKQMRWNLVEHERFYNARRQIIKHDYIWHRWLHPDARMLEEAEKALQSFNASAPGRLRITKKELADYRKSRLGTIRRKESGKPTSRRMRREAKEVQRIWGAGNESRGKDLFQ